MIIIRKDNQRGHSQIDWLNSFHTFSFGEYFDSNFMGFGNLRVINEDTVQPAQGFGRHPHKNMEIISYVIQGALEHKDSLGTGSVIRPGEIQRMSAGTGVTHSEFNHSKTDPLHFLQIWIIPKDQNISPSYEQKTIPAIKNQWVLIGSSEGSADAIKIHQDVELYSAQCSANHSLEYIFKNDRIGWLQVVNGKITLNNELLTTGDGAAIQNEKKLKINCIEDAEFLFFDMGITS